MNKSPEDMTVDELQQAILAKMAGNGLVTDQMKKQYMIISGMILW